jgi:hypothetical protein
MCERGLHGSLDPFDALTYAPGETLCRVQLGGTIIQGDDKCVATRRKIVTRVDATSLLWSFARSCALDVVKLWDAPPVVVQYLTTGEESLRAAARDAAWADAGDAARAAARYAARYAAWADARYAAWADAGAAAGDAAGAAAQDAARYAAGDAAGDAARYAAWADIQDAARYAARYAAWADAGAAAGDAAWAAAGDAQKKRFSQMVKDLFKEVPR